MFAAYDGWRSKRESDAIAEASGKFKPEGKHTARYDIYNSIAELKHYRETFLKLESDNKWK